MKTQSRNIVLALTTLLSIIGQRVALAQITNVHFERACDLMEQGSNLIIFQSTITFTNPKSER